MITLRYLVGSDLNNVGAFAARAVVTELAQSAAFIEFVLPVLLGPLFVCASRLGARATRNLGAPWMAAASFRRFAYLRKFPSQINR